MIEDYLKKELDNLDYLVENTNRINRKNRFIRNLKLTGNFIKYHTCPFVLIGSLMFGGLLLTKSNLPFVKDDTIRYKDYTYDIVNERVVETINYVNDYRSYISVYFDDEMVNINADGNNIDSVINGDYSFIKEIIGNKEINRIIVHNIGNDIVVTKEDDLNNIKDTILFLIASVLLTMMIPKDNNLFKYNKYTRNKELILYGHNDLDHKYLMNAKKIREDNLKRLK